MNIKNYICKAVTVYCSSSEHVDNIYIDTAQEMGRLIGENGYTLVFGGCKVGLMGAVSAGAREKGGKVIGIALKKFVIMGICDPKISEMYTVEDIWSRKKILEETGDAYVSLPGGFSTLEEITEAISTKQIGFHNKPIIIVNVNGFFDYLIRQFELSFEERFAEKRFRNSYQIVKNPSEAINIIKNYQPPDMGLKYNGSLEFYRIKKKRFNINNT